MTWMQMIQTKIPRMEDQTWIAGGWVAALRLKPEAEGPAVE